MSADDLLSTYRGLMQGVYYGAKIRLPHATVMTLLFQSGSLSQKARAIAWMTFQHARNLGAFVLLYKGSVAVLRNLDGFDKDRAAFGIAGRPLHALAAGAVGGYCVWSNYSSVNFQIVLYLLSRVGVALVKLAASHGLLGSKLSSLSFADTYPYLATTTWALVLWLYEFHPSLLHPSLASSMRTLYADSNHWSALSDFVPSPPAAAVAAYLVASLYWVDKKPISSLFDFSKTRL